MSDHFDPAPYLRPLHLDTAALLKLAEQLLARLPASAAEQRGLQRAADGLRGAVHALTSTWQPAARPDHTAARALDLAIDNAWSVLYWRLDAFAGLPAAHWPLA